MENTITEYAQEQVAIIRVRVLATAPHPNLTPDERRLIVRYMYLRYRNALLGTCRDYQIYYALTGKQIPPSANMIEYIIKLFPPNNDERVPPGYAIHRVSDTGTIGGLIERIYI